MMVFVVVNGMILYADLSGRQAPHGGKISHILVSALAPDIFIYRELSERVVIFKLTRPDVPVDSNSDRSHDFKLAKYAPLVSDLSSAACFLFFTVEISVRGQVTKNNQFRLKGFLLKCCDGTGSLSKSFIRVSSKAALLSSNL